MAKTKAVADIPLDSVVLDYDYYPRTPESDENSWQEVQRYIEALEQGAMFPPIEVVKRGGEYILLDGRRRTLAHRRVKRTQISATIWTGMPKNQWLEYATKQNVVHGRCLTSQDRTRVAAMLKQQGRSLERIAKVLQCRPETVSKWLIERTVELPDGTIVAMKAPLRGLVGSVNQNKAIANQRPLAARTVAGILDQVIALFKGGMIDFNDPEVAKRIDTLREEIDQIPKRTDKAA